MVRIEGKEMKAKNKTAVQIAASFGRAVPIDGRPGHFCLHAPWVGVSGFLRKMARLNREFVGPWHCDGSADNRSWAVIYPWQK